MNKKKLDEITRDLVENYFRNSDIIYPNMNVDEMEDIILDLLEVIASLHNELYKAVMGNYYDYMFHWVNKVTGGIWEHLDDKYKD